MTRVFDFIASFVGLIVFSPLLIILSLLILIDSGRPIFYLQQRVGKNGKVFNLLKFRSMHQNSEKKGLLTVGSDDNRITNIGKVLRKYKLDELPQLINVMKGDMAIVGPRPEVQRYVDLYNDEQRKVLDVRPGITDLASIEYINENEILAASTEPEKTYVEEIMPHKIEINLRYIQNKGLFSDIGVIIKTILKIVS